MSTPQLSPENNENEVKPMQSSTEENIQENESQCSSTSDNAEHVQQPSFILGSFNSFTRNVINDDNDSDKDSIDQLCIDNGKKDNEEELPRYMRNTRSSIIREQNRIEEEHHKAMSMLPKEHRSTISGSRISSFTETPHYMKETNSFRHYSLSPSSFHSSHLRPDQIRPVDPNNKPRYMQETEAYKKQIEKEEGKKKVLPQQIKEVDMKNKPRYMQETEAYKKQIEKEEGKKKVLPQQIKEVDMKNKPRYMQETEAYKKQVEKEIAVVSPKRKMKEVDMKNKPRYMQGTKAWEQHIKEEETEVRSVNANSIRSVNTKELPRYMQLTKACEQHLIKEEVKEMKSVPKKMKNIEGIPHFSKVTLSYTELLKKMEQEKQEKAKREQELLRQRNSLAVRKDRWEQARQRAERCLQERKQAQAKKNVMEKTNSNAEESEEK